jgi:hypothetical protein
MIPVDIIFCKDFLPKCASGLLAIAGRDWGASFQKDQLTTSASGSDRWKC